MSTSVSARPCYAFLRQGELFSSLTSNYLPDVPVRPGSYDTHCPTYSESQTPRWLDPRYHSIAFTPLAPRFDNQFGILKAPRHELVEEIPDNNNGGSRYQTPEVLCWAFMQLEADLVEIKNILTDAIISPGLEFRTIPEPSTYGYQRSHGNARTARRAIEQSRDAFIVLMAYISYLIAMFDDSIITVGPQVGGLRRWEYILQQGDISRERIQDLRRSEICEFGPSYPRVGVFVRYNDWTFHQAMQKCIKYGVPVWVHWPSAECWSPDPAVLDHLPTQQEISAARAAAIGHERGETDSVAEQQNTETSWGTFWGNSSVEVSSVQPPGSVDLSTPLPGGQTDSTPKTLRNTEVPSSSLHSSNMKFPSSIPGSRQKYGETPHQFIKRMAEARLRRIEIEDTRSRQQRESREKAQMDHAIPGQGSKAPVVWHWQEDEETGVRRRVRVFRQAVDQYWEMYSNKQRYFDAFHNEWDICTEFDSDTEHPDGHDMDDDFCMSADIGPIHNSISLVPPASSSSAKLSGSLALHSTPSPLISPGEDTDALCIIPPGEGTADVPPPIVPSGEGTSDVPPHVNSSGDNSESEPSPINFVGGLLDLLHERYGFLRPRSNDGAVYNSMLDWRSTRAILGLSSESQRVQELLAHDNNIRNDRLQKAISCFIENLLRRTEKMPMALWDIHPDSHEPLQQNPHFRIRKRKVHFEHLANTAQAYLISAIDSSDRWTVMLHDAATVLECHRRCSTLTDMLRFLSTNGRPFRTLSPRNLIEQPKPQRVLAAPTLGVFPPDYSPTLHDYRHYEQLRRDFCKLPRARAAVLKGGIIWRLVLDGIGAPAEQIVSDGVFTYGTSLQDPDSSEVLCNDELTEGEMDFICGVYTLFTGKHSPTTDHLHIS